MIKRIWFGLIAALLTGAVLACGANTLTLAERYPEHAAYYEIFVRSFADSDNDGIGDFGGIAAKAEYLADLGFEGVWLMPIHPSPSYHGYDVMDYYAVNEDYGTMADFEAMVEALNEVGIKVMLDMVFNHTSNQHPWFVAANNGDAAKKAFYVTQPSTTNTSDLVGSWGQSIWHYTNAFKYCGYFSHTMPDLNMNNPAVFDEIVAISKFWIDKGVEGFRLDAVLHLFGDNEYLGESHDYFDSVLYLQDYIEAIDAYKDGIYVIGEAWIENMTEVVADFYYGVDAPLNFDISSLIRSAAAKTTNRTYVSNLVRMYDVFQDRNRDFIDAPFIGNHDIQRIASLFNGNQTQLRLAAEMLLALPGNPIVYYGDELGMFGYKSNGPDIWDETIRMPYLFEGGSRTDWIDSSHPTFLQLQSRNDLLPDAASQLADPASLLNVYRTLLNLRKNTPALKYGNQVEAYADNTAALQGYYRTFVDGEKTYKVLVLHNFGTAAIRLDTFPQGTVLYMTGSSYGQTPTELPGASTLILDLTVTGE
jgi:glycosidase